MITSLILLATGILLPTWDVYSDIYFTVWLFRGNYYNRDECESQETPIMVPPHPKFGSAVLTPILLSWIILARKWYVTEKSMKQKLLTLPFLLLQVYPQWKAVQVLYHSLVRSGKSVRMKNELETRISHIGKHY